MLTRLIQTVAFTDVAAGATVSLPHNININQVAKVPDFVATDAPGFDATATDTEVTVTNTGTSTASVNVWLELKHTIPRELGALANLTPQPFVVAGGSGGSGSASQLLSIYGDGSWGDYATSGDEAWDDTVDLPGQPALPSTSIHPWAFYNNLTISAGDSVNLGATSTSVIVFVKGTLTIEAGARIHVNGEDGTTGSNPFGNAGGQGGFSFVGGVSGGGGGVGGVQSAGWIGGGGDGFASRPALANGTMNGGAGGNASTNAGGLGGTCQASPSFPYSLATVLGMSNGLLPLGGGNGGGGGAGSTTSGYGGGGGGGGGVIMIVARNIVAGAGSIQAKGGAGGAGYGLEGAEAGGGGGGSGGSIIIITENTTLAGVTNVNGGTGGAGANGGLAGTDGGAGEAIALNPTLAMCIAA